MVDTLALCNHHSNIIQAAAALNFASARKPAMKSLFVIARGGR